MTIEIETFAKPFINNRYWILTQNGQKIGVLNKIKSQYIISSNGKTRAEFTSKKKLLDKIPIKFITEKKIEIPKKTERIYNYPINVKKSFNFVIDVARQLLMFTKKKNSICWFGAGYYLIYFNKNGWTIYFCPKIIILNRYNFKGPFMSKLDAIDILPSLK